jgi:uncharacterized protein YecE (DUF72 family)
MPRNGMQDAGARDVQAPKIGCCGWGQAQGRYFGEFPVIEIQSTFYHPPAVKVAEKWRMRAPAQFEFCIKAWQLITHAASSPTYRRLRSPVEASERDALGFFQNSEPVWRAWETTRAIADAVDAKVIVFQCPASFAATSENVRNFGDFFRKLGRQPRQMAWEPRGPWPAELVREMCAEFGLIHCVDPFVNESVFGDPLYWRLHGKGGYSYRYTDEDLCELRRWLVRRESARPAYVMFNNAAMREDGRRFQELMAAARL